MSNAAEKAAAARRAREKQRQKMGPEDIFNRAFLIALIAIPATGILISILLFVASASNSLGFLAFANVLFWMAVVFLVLSLATGIVNIVICYNNDDFDITDILFIILQFVTTLTCLVAICVYHCSGKRWYKGETVQEGVHYVLMEDNAFVSGFDGTEENVEILESIEGKPVREIQSKAFYGNSVIKTLKFNSDIKIQPEAFADCRNLESIDFGDNVITFGAACFSYCRSLSYVHFGQGEFLLIEETSNDTYWPFYKCDAELTLDADGAIIDLPTLYRGCALRSFHTVKLGARTTLYTNELTEWDTLVLKDDFRFANGKALLETGIFSVTTRTLARNIYIPATIDKIPKGFFGDELPDEWSSAECYYGGSEEDWRFLLKEQTGNNTLFANKINMHYDSVYQG